MKKLLLSILLAFVAVAANGASPDYKNFYPPDFTTNNVSPAGQISIRINTNKFLTTNSSIAQHWGTNATDGSISNVNFGFGVVADYSSFNTNEVIHFGPLTNGGATGFRFQPFSFHGVGFNIDSAGNGTAFGTDVNNSSNWFQIGLTREVPIMEIDTNNSTFFGSNVTFKRFITNSQLTASMPVWTDANKALVSVTPPNLSWVPMPGREVWYEPFNGNNMGSGGAHGALGWTAQSSGAGGGGVSVSNSPNHWGTVALTVSTSANSIEALFGSSALNSKPPVSRMDQQTGWTNRFIWRLSVTNDLKAHICWQNGNFTQSALENSIGIFVNSTNSNQIMGMTSASSVLSTTNLGTIVAAQWYTNEIWCNSSGVISFSLNGGAEATLNSTLPTTGLTPAFGILKVAANNAAALEIDEWVVVWTRQ